MIRAIFLLIIFSTVFSVSTAAIIEKCGTYIAEGNYIEVTTGETGKKEKVILLNRGTNAEIKFYVVDKNHFIPKSHIGVNFQFKLQFLSRCDYLCQGNIVEIVRPLEPYEMPKKFTYPKSIPAAGSEVKCQPNALKKY